MIKIPINTITSSLGDKKIEITKPIPEPKIIISPWTQKLI
jgi:hypothetical protein